MQLGLVGATGGIGGTVLAEALAAGHGIVAVTRDAARLATSADGQLTIVEGDVRDPAVAARLVAGSTAVIATLGVSANAPSEADAAEAAMKAIVEAMRAAGVRRLVSLSGAAVTLPGEVKPLSGRIAGRIVGLAARWVVEAKRREADIILASDLEWTLVRPPNVVAGPAHPAVRLRPDLPAGSFRVSQTDVAAALLRCATEQIYLREAPFVG